MTSPLRITFLGGASEIGASSALVQVADRAVLIDAGVRFRAGRALPDLDALTGKHLDAIVVTHAHSDHTGALPVVHEAFREAPILMTPPTRDLVSILQRDALKLMNSPDREDDVPLYSERQVESMVERIRPVHHHESVTVGELVITYIPASHILGASMVHLATPAGNVLFTGDYSVGEQRSVARLPRPALPIDLIVSETTYGDRLHADRGTAEARLVRTLGEVLEKGGRVLIPAFAIGRAQEVLLIVKDALRSGKLPDVPVFLDGMVRSVCGVYAQHERYATAALARDIRAEGHPFFTKQIRAVASPKDRKHVLNGGPCVIVASSGMLTGGPSAYYAAELAPNERDAILITGYQDEESPGRALLNLAEKKGPRTLTVAGKSVEVRCRFETYSLSAHADRTQMMGMIEALRPSSVVLVHGDRGAKEGLARGLGAKDIVLADDGTSLERAFARTRAASMQEKKPLELLARPTIAAAFVGPDTGVPLRARALASAWFGREVDAAMLERFVGVLEHAGAVRRDEADRLLLVSLVPSLAADGEDDPTLVETLKAENPKGRLFELCAKKKIVLPKVREVRKDQGRHVIEMTMHDGGQARSGMGRAFASRVAEQLAARSLLEGLAELARPDDVDTREVSDDDEERLRHQNPKGRLLELCAKKKLAAPVFAIAVGLDGYEGHAHLTLPNEMELASPVLRAKNAKLVEQALSAELLRRLDGFGRDVPAQLTTSAMPSSAPATVGGDGRSALNEMRQAQRILGFGFELCAQHGPPHQPTFVMRGWLTTSAGARVETEAIEARSKKEGETSVSVKLLELALTSALATNASGM